MKTEHRPQNNTIDTRSTCSHQLTGTFRSACVLIALGTLLVAGSVTVYRQTGQQPFLNFDDTVYVTENTHVAKGLTADAIVWAFTSIDASNWHPLTWLSHMADIELFGMNPRGHHLTNVAIHTVTVLLLFLLLLRLTGAVWRSFCVAALFALHPLHVESVAWVAERKDVLSGLLWFVTLLMYSGYAVQRNRLLYLLTLIAFVLGLLAKPMLVTLPLVMLLLDGWPLKRYGDTGTGSRQHSFSTLVALIKEKIPFFAAALFSSIITIYAQQSGGSVRALTEIPLWLRIENAALAYVTYLSKTVLPHNLAILYPFPQSIPLWQFLGSAALLLLVSVMVMRARRHNPYLAVGWFWFLISLLPVIGLLQVGRQALADRYMYIPIIGLLIMAVWGVADLTARWRHHQLLCALLTGAVILASAAGSWRQLGYWRDNISLYRHTLSVTTDNVDIHYNLANTLQARGQFEEAIRNYQAAVRINPGHAEAHNNLGTALARRGDLTAAISEFQVALRLNPLYQQAANNLRHARAQTALPGH